MIDAHNHLHDARLEPWRAELLAELPKLGVQRAVVNGTREADWPAVAALAKEQAWVRPSFGLHPWYVKDRSEEWLAKLREQLDAHPGCGVGEIGLDRWIEGYDLKLQKECFTAQITLAAERNLPATIHCLRAWGALWELIHETPLPKRGFLLHAYGGPAVMVAGFVELGAYFSFSTSFLHERKTAERELFAKVPEERLLVETDAPDMAPPPAYRELPVVEGKRLNHPGNIEHAYAGLARVREMEVGKLVELVEGNFGRWFG
jgi:TatD DNase family protein